MKRVLVIIPLFLLFFSLTAAAAGAPKIAVSSEGTFPSSQVSAIAARCPYFLVFDGKGKLLETLENPYRTAAGGAGSQVVGFLAGKGTTVVVAGAFGQNMVRGMQAKGIRYLEFKGTVADAVKKALK
jgi:predicted Fe-Mo cluster-binding NifX family protein